MINARIFDGDIVYIRQQDTVENGEIAAVLIESEATLKRVKCLPDRIILEPENPMYKPFIFWNEHRPHPGESRGLYQLRAVIHQAPHCLPLPVWSA